MQRVNGWYQTGNCLPVLLVPNDEHVQRRLISTLRRLSIPFAQRDSDQRDLEPTFKVMSRDWRSLVSA